MSDLLCVEHRWIDLLVDNKAFAKVNGKLRLGILGFKTI